jgi:hypothetical protein
MIAPVSAPRRVIAGLALALLAPFVAALLAAPSANALPPICNIDCPPQIITYTAEITVTPPAVGTVHGTNDSDARTIDCSGSGGSCTITDHQASDSGFPSDGWPTWTFSFTGATGYIATWSGACSGLGNCVITNDKPSTQSITAGALDIAPPAVSLSAPARVSPTTAIGATATDNSGAVSREDWYVCNPNGFACALQVQAANNTTFHLTGQAAGNYLIRFDATDPSGNRSSTERAVTLVTGLSMTSSDLPAVTAHPSFTFASDDEAFSTSQCRAYPTGGTVPAWGACTTKNSYAPDLSDGNWTLQAEEVDDLGNLAAVTKTTTVDATAPSVTITGGPVEGDTVGTPTVQFSFDATDANLQSVTCTLDNGAASPCSSTKSLSGYADGAHTFKVTATDKVEHVTTVVRHFSALVPTTLTGHSTTNTYGSPAKLAVSVSPAQSAGTVTFTSGGRTLCTAKISNATASCRAPATLASGTHAVTAAYHGGYAASSTKFTLTTKKQLTAIHASAVTTIKRGKKLTVSISRLPRAATGTVTVANGSTKLCSTTVHGGSARCSFIVKLGKGVRSLAVRYGGSRNYGASTQTIKVKVV